MHKYSIDSTVFPFAYQSWVSLKTCWWWAKIPCIFSVLIWSFKIQYNLLCLYQILRFLWVQLKLVKINFYLKTKTKHRCMGKWWHCIYYSLFFLYFKVHVFLWHFPSFLTKFLKITHYMDIMTKYYFQLCHSNLFTKWFYPSFKFLVMFGSWYIYLCQ